MNRRHALVLLSALPLALAAGRAAAGSRQIFAPGGVAIHGMDPLGYFDEGRPVAGDERFPLMWKGATWLFASARNRAQFEADPWRYAPAFGGYCANAMSEGIAVPTDPEVFVVFDGKLFLMRSGAERLRWLQDPEQRILQGRAHWPDVVRDSLRSR